MKRIVLALLVVLVAAFVPGFAAAGPALPMPTDDHGMFLNILPAGQGTTTTSQDAIRYESTGTAPAHDVDQESMYSSLRLAQGLQDSDLSKYYKPETFLPPTGTDVESTESPEQGLTIMRDTFGVPHIYGDTRSEAMFGAGYVTAQDRLFEADVLRHVGRGRLSEFLGPSKSNLQMDEAAYAVAGYNEKELQAQVDRLHQLGPEGDQVIQDGKDFIAGINARLTADMNNPSQMPAEYAALQIQPQPWTETDLVAVALLIQAEFAGGGGSELQNAIFLKDAQKKLGDTKGRQLWRDMREMEDPAAPVTADGTFPYMIRHNVNPKAVAMPDPSSVKQYTVVTTSGGSSGNIAHYTGQGALELLHRGLQRLGLMVPNGASNWLAVTAKHTASHHPIAVMGPQVGYFAPEILMEMDIHAPGLDARGATFPGISLYVLLGRGPDFAWSATSGESDLIDVRAERLCEPNGGTPTTSSTHYVFHGQCTAMYTRTDTWFAKPSAGGTGSPTQVTATVERTVHGPVIATGTVGGQPVAFTSQRSSFGAELDSAVSFIDLNGDRVTNPATFKRAMSKLTGSFNWLYVDDKHVAYFHSGLYPIRATGVDPDLPSWGTGQWEWKGFLPASKHPQAVDPAKGWIDSWNNKPARDWRAADSKWAYGPVHRVQMLANQLRTLIPKNHVTAADMVQIMVNASTIDLRGQQDLPYLLKAIGNDPKDQKTLAILKAWVKGGAHRIDRNGDGAYDDQAAVAFMDAWWPVLIQGIFDKEMGGLYSDVPMGFDNHPGPRGSSFLDGYYGQVQKAVQMALGQHVPGPYRVLRCGDGTLAGCRRVLVASLRAVEKQLGADSSKWDPKGTIETNDSIHYAAVGLVGAPDMPWQNRPTFQQVVEATTHR